jgi:NADH dehydrogenase
VNCLVGDQLIPGIFQNPTGVQEGRTAAANFLRNLRGEWRLPFRYKDKVSMATIERHRAVAKIGRWHLSGYFAWLMWAFVHLILLIGFSNRLMVIREWVWSDYTRERSARLITGDTDAPTWNPRRIEATGATKSSA